MEENINRLYKSFNPKREIIERVTVYCPIEVGKEVMNSLYDDGFKVTGSGAVIDGTGRCLYIAERVSG